MSRTRTLSLLGAALMALALTVTVGSATAAKPPKIGHVFVIMLENELRLHLRPHQQGAVPVQTLPAKGAFVPNYYGITREPGQLHRDDQRPGTHAADPGRLPRVLRLHPDRHGRRRAAAGDGVYPASVKTLANQLRPSD